MSQQSISTPRTQFNSERKGDVYSEFERSEVAQARFAAPHRLCTLSLARKVVLICPVVTTLVC